MNMLLSSDHRWVRRVAAAIGACAILVLKSIWEGLGELADGHTFSDSPRRALPVDADDPVLAESYSLEIVILDLFGEDSETRCPACAARLWVLRGSTCRCPECGQAFGVRFTSN